MTDYPAVVKKQRLSLGAYCIQDWDELHELAPLVEELKPMIIVEIGCADAGWPYIFAPWFAPGAMYVGIDTLQRFPTNGPRLERTLQKLRDGGMTAHFVQGRSDAPEVLTALKVHLAGRQIDLLHIDGGHDYATATSDYNTYGPLVREGGLVALHDVELVKGTAYNVRPLWEEIVAACPGKTQKFYHTVGIGVVEM